MRMQKRIYKSQCSKTFSLSSAISLLLLVSFWEAYSATWKEVYNVCSNSVTFRKRKHLTWQVQFWVGRNVTVILCFWMWDVDHSVYHSFIHSPHSVLSSVFVPSVSLGKKVKGAILHPTEGYDLKKSMSWDNYLARPFVIPVVPKYYYCIKNFWIRKSKVKYLI